MFSSLSPCIFEFDAWSLTQRSINHELDGDSQFAYFFEAGVFDGLGRGRSIQITHKLFNRYLKCHQHNSILQFNLNYSITIITWSATHFTLTELSAVKPKLFVFSCSDLMCQMYCGIWRQHKTHSLKMLEFCALKTSSSIADDQIYSEE